MENERVTALDGGVGRQPLYAALAAVLARDIRAGKYAASSVMPSEKELCELYGVSRHTVREAVREIREQGLVSSHRGIGTVVRDPAVRQSTFSAVNSVGDLLHFVGTTEMHALGVREVTADEELVQLLEFKPGQLLSEAAFLRKAPGETLPMSYLLIYVHPRYAAAQRTPAVSSSPIYKNIETMFGVRLNEIRQDISATELDADLALVLQAKVGSAAMRILRFYYDLNDNLIQASISYYPSGRYTQSARFRAAANPP